MIDTTQLMNETDINEALIKLGNKMMECYNECCLIKTKIVSSKDQIIPWIYQSIKNNVVKRQNNYKLYQRGLFSERDYKYFRYFMNNQIRIAKKK